MPKRASPPTNSDVSSSRARGASSARRDDKYSKVYTQHTYIRVRESMRRIHTYARTYIDGRIDRCMTYPLSDMHTHVLRMIITNSGTR